MLPTAEEIMFPTDRNVFMIDWWCSEFISAYRDEYYSYPPERIQTSYWEQPWERPDELNGAPWFKEDPHEAGKSWARMVKAEEKRQKSLHPNMRDFSVHTDNPTGGSVFPPNSMMISMTLNDIDIESR